jgi:hypothetical protein
MAEWYDPNGCLRTVCCGRRWTFRADFAMPSGANAGVAGSVTFAAARLDQ